MISIKNETIKRIIFSFILVLFFIPFFVITKYTGQEGRIFSSVIYIILTVYCLYEVLLSLKMSQIISILSSICVPLFFIFPLDNFISIIKLNINGTSILVKRAISSWEGWVLLIFFSILPLLLQNQKKLLEINYWIYQMMITSIFLLIPVFGKLMWVYNIRGFKVLTFLILIATISDVGGYFGGKYFGNKWFKGKKLAPKISPKKTYSGFFVGSVLAIIFAVLYGYFINIWENFENQRIFFSFFFGIILPLIAPLGDLYFSLIKRIVKIDNFSNLIPGHGGFMDRIDALCFISIFFGFIMLFDFN